MSLEWAAPRRPARPWRLLARWWWRRWRARRYAWRADLAWRRRPTAANARTRDRAAGHLRRVETGRP